MEQEYFKLYSSVPLQFFKSPQSSEYKKIKGKFGLNVILAENRKNKRKLDETLTSIYKPFNPSKFNFTEIKEEEFLCTLKFSQNKHNPVVKFCNKVLRDPKYCHLVINYFPCMPFHTLFLPYTFKKLSQYITLPSIKHALILFTSFSKDSYIRMGFNSLAANSSVNHLHFQVFSSLQKFPGDGTFLSWPIEQVNLNCSSLKKRIRDEDKKSEMEIGYVSDDQYFTEFFYVLLVSESNSEYIQNMTGHIFRIIKLLHMNDIAHNLFFGYTNKEKMFVVYIIPRKKVLELNTMENSIAFLEMAGCFITMERNVYNNVDETTLVKKVRNAKLCENKILNICEKIF